MADVVTTTGDSSEPLAPLSSASSAFGAVESGGGGFGGGGGMHKRSGLSVKLKFPASLGFPAESAAAPSAMLIVAFAELLLWQPLCSNVKDSVKLE